ncbi:hypothetical protein DYB32_008953 [Aphanomyces invadans]|uniref:Uncharacterized protein n=1 Tax=Aphanomyces invadans TaxID=157072 RepID=A0A3R6VRB7_9STRA|nr:hypothetical protein DYB32_008953 [Aphanomyces invadans]
MKMSCGSLRKHVSFSCNMTADTIMFHQYAAVYRHPWNMQGTPESRNFIDSNSFTGLDFHATTPRKYPDRAWYDQETTESSAVTRQTSRGIVMVVYGKALVPLYATVQYLRHDLASTLPIEIWYRSDEVNPHNNSVLAAIANLPHVHMREILDPLAQGFYVKPYVIFFSQFRQVLFLDADNLPLHDPAFLFDTPEFKRDGAIFWPDFWHPENTIFNVHRGSFVWTLLNHPFVDMFEQESGQLVIDRARCERALHLLMFYAFHRIRPQEPIEYSMLDDGPVLPVDPNLIAALALVWGDKDLFRLAWLKTNTSFYMVERPPGALGVYGRPPMKGDRGGFTPEDDETLPVRFCGKAMVQYNMGNQSQEPLFLHRNTVKLSQTNTTRVKQWFAFQELRPSIAKYQDVKDKYVIQAWAERTSCFGEHLGATEAFSLADTNGTIFEAAEAQLLKYADQAAAMLPPEKTPPPAKKRAIAPTVARSHPIKSPAAEPDLKDLMLG